MVTIKHPSNQDNYLNVYRKYFRGISPNSAVPFEPFDFREADLGYLLKEYKLESHSPIFSRLASHASYYVKTWKQGQNLRNTLVEIYNQEVDLVNLAWKLETGKVGWIELRCNTGDKVKLSYPSSIQGFGEAILTTFSNVCTEEDLARLEKKQNRKGKPPVMMPIQNLIFDILKYLDKETELKCNGKLITNEQTRFIFEFLQLSQVIEPNSPYDEEYIRTTLNNFKVYMPELFIPLSPKPLK